MKLDPEAFIREAERIYREASEKAIEAERRREIDRFEEFLRTVSTGDYLSGEWPKMKP
jgi:hypothetical protein